jgi:hypothetical protein
MGSSNKLSAMAGYYVRRLLQSHKASLLKQMEHASLSEAMLQEPEAILNYLVTNPSERLQRLNNLEILARASQKLVADGQHPEQLINVEKQIMMALGFSDAVALGVLQNPKAASADHQNQKLLNIAKAVEIMEAMAQCGERYLGPKISRDYMFNTCPESLKQNGFSFQDDQRLQVSSRPMTDILQGIEVEDFKEWIKLYLRRCSTIVGGFDALVNQQHLAYCSISPQDI